MMNLKKASLLAAVSVMLAPAAFAASTPKDVVKDARGGIVRSTNGNCVITKWDAAYEECTGQMNRRDLTSLLTKEQRTVYFDFNKSTLGATEKKQLDEVSKIVAASKEVESVDIVGFADPIGNAGYNKRLSTKRAQTVKSYLAKKGLKTRNIRVEGLGESATAKCGDAGAGKASKELIACLAPDRRVEIMLNGVAK